MMRVSRGGSVETEVAASPDAVWAVLTDVTRVGEWSHETRGARWLDGDRAAVGATFRGANKAGAIRWSRVCTITDLVEPSKLAYITDGKLFGDSARWVFELVPVPGGTRIIQTHQVVSLPRWLELIVFVFVPAHRGRLDALSADLERLGALAALESRTAS
jgi:hypothetical protein